MRLITALQKAGRAARANVLPGLLLQALMLVFLALYFWHDGTRRFLIAVAHLKQETGYAFAFVTYAIAAAMMPEVLRIVFFQHGRMTRTNVWRFLTAAPLWGGMGMVVDLFYRLQGRWFGTGSDAGTVLIKMAVDQFLYSPFISGPILVGYLHWRDSRFRFAALRECFTSDFILGRLFPVVVSGWCIWIPGVCLVYFMPPELQIPVAVLIQVFWALILTTVFEDRKITT